jgi:very-short-patch-repair endonuclease
VSRGRLVDVIAGRSFLEDAFVRWVLAPAVTEGIAAHVVGQHAVAVDDRTYRLDFLLAGSRVRVAVELDGFAFHSSKAAFVYDRIRQNDLTTLGYVVLRFSYEAIRDHTARCVAQLQAVLRGDPTLAAYLIADPLVPVPHDMTPNPLGLATPPERPAPAPVDYFDQVRQRINWQPLRDCQREALVALANYYRRGGVDAACVMSVGCREDSPRGGRRPSVYAPAGLDRDARAGHPGHLRDCAGPHLGGQCVVHAARGPADPRLPATKKRGP